MRRDMLGKFAGEDDTARFWSKVDVLGDRECWPWIGGWTDPATGRGYFSLGGRDIPAPRAALILAGFDMTGLVSRHTCDNPPCVNPTHLHPGTQRENLADMRARGRA